jgi:hypothetical protein
MIKIIDNGKRSTMWFGDLDVGDTFLWNEQLFIKSNEHLGALNLDCGGEYEELGVDEQVIPVDIEIKVIR